VSAYLAFATKAFAREATYRFEVFTTIGSLLLRVYLLRQLWTALYARNAGPADLPLHAMITYSAVALLMSLVMEVDGSRIMQTRIREGTIATDFMKPISIPLFVFSDGIGRTLFEAMTILPSLALALFIVHIDLPSPGTFGIFLLSFACGYIVNTALNFMMNAIAFWTLEIHALQLSVRWASDLLSGQIIPLSLFPGALGTLVGVLPFAAIYSTPLRIYTGQLAPDGYTGAIAAQLGWGVLFTGFAYLIWRRASRRVVVQGG